MADLSDCLDALVALFAAAIYPNGTALPSAINADVSIFPGWPNAADLDAKLRAGRTCISIYPPPNLERDETRFMAEWQVQTPATPTMSATISGHDVTLAGTVTAGQIATLFVDGVPYSVAAQASDTLVTMASGLATLINAVTPASSAGDVITVSDTDRLVARFGATGTLVKEVERSQRGFMATIWAPSPDLRKRAGTVVRQAGAANPFINLADGSAARLIYRMTNDSDEHETAILYRRDVHYWVEYATFLEADAYSVTAPTLATQPAQADGTALASPVTTYP